MIKISPRLRRTGQWIWQNMDAKRTESSLSVALSIILRIGGLLIAVFAVLLIWRLIRDDGYTMEAFSVPADLESCGFNGAYIARHVQDQLFAIKQEAGSVKADSLHIGGGENPDLNVKMLGMELSLNSIAHQLRLLFGRPVKTVRGEVTRSGDQLTLILRMSGYTPVNIAQQVEKDQEMAAVEMLCRHAAEAIVGLTDPYRLAVIHYRRGEFTQALELVRRIIRERPHERHWGYLAWGSILDKQGNTEMAISKFQRATELDSTFSLAWRRWGQCLMMQRKWKEAMNKYETALRHQPDNPDAWLEMGWMYFRSKQLRESDAAFAQARRYAPREALVWISCAEAKQQQDSLASALAIAQKAVELGGESSAGYIARAICAMIQHDTAAAIRHSLYAAELDPSNQFAAGMGIMAAFQTKNYPKAVEIGRAVNLSRVDKYQAIQIHNYLAMSYNFLGRHDSAFAIIRRGIALDTLMPYPYSTLAETYAFTGQKEAFYQNLEKAFRLGMETAAVAGADEPYRRFAGEERFQALIRKYEKK